MTIIPASNLSRAEMHMLGTNVVAAVRQDRSDVSAVNRSLGAHGEAVDSLTAIPQNAPPPGQESAA